MPDYRHVVHVAVDSYSPRGDLIGTVLGARAVDTSLHPQDVLEELFGQLRSTYRQLRYDECVDLLATRGNPETATWDQLSIF